MGSTATNREEFQGELEALRTRVADLERAETGREQALAALRKGEERFRLAVRGTSDGLWDWEVATGKVWWSQQYRELIGYSDGELPATYESWESLLHPDDREHALEAIRRHLEEGQAYDIEYRLRTKSGAYRWFLARGVATRDADGKPIRMAGSIQDVTERKRMEERLAVRRQQQAAVAQLGRRALGGIDLDDLFDEAVAVLAKTLQIEYCKILELLPGGDAVLLRAGVGWPQGLVGSATIPTGSDSQAGYTLRSREPVIVADLKTETRFSGPALLHDHNVVSGMSVIIGGVDHPHGVLGAHTTRRRDFSEDDVNFLQAVANLLADAISRARDESALRESEEKYRQLFATGSDAIIVFDADTRRILDVNPAAQKLYEYSEEEFLELQVVQISAEPEKTAAATDAVIEGNLAKTPLRYHRKKGGTAFPVEISPAYFKLKGRNVGCGVIRDISERMRAEDKLRFLSLITEQVSDSVIATNLNYEITYVNSSFQKIYGYSAQELLGESPGVLNVEPNSEEIQNDIYRTVSSGATWRGEFRNRKKDGSLFLCDLMAFPLIDEQGNTFAYAGIQRDITERKREEEEKQKLENQLRQSQKMEAVGQLAGGVAHDFNNILTVILGNVELLLPMMKPGLDESATERVRSGLEEIRWAAERTAALTRQLTTFGRKGIVKEEVLELDRAIRGAEQLLRRLLRADIAFGVNVAPGTSHIRADAGQFEQVIMNLVLNASDAMPKGGTLTVTCSNVDVDQAHVTAHVGAKSGPHVMVTVSDTGVGMSQELMDHVFEPFFTTKPTGKGTGLGLATVYGIVTQAGGHLAVESEVGKGSAFTVYLPAVEEEAAKPETAASVEGSHGDEVILVCEDEEIVRRVTCQLLRATGYTVLEAENGRHALEVAADYNGRIDLLLSDVIMPEMNGKELGEAMARRNPGMPVVFVSGYAGDVLDAQVPRDGGWDFLQKPFSTPVLLQRVRELLDRRSPL